MAQDIFTSFKNYANKLSGGEKSPAEIAAALKNWFEESGEMIKEKIETEIEAAAARLGFVKSSDLAPIMERLTVLEAELSKGKKSTAKKSAPTKKAPSSTTNKKAPVKKAATKKSAPSAAKGARKAKGAK